MKGVIDVGFGVFCVETEAKKTVGRAGSEEGSSHPEEPTSGRVFLGSRSIYPLGNNPGRAILWNKTTWLSFRGFARGRISSVDQAPNFDPHSLPAPPWMKQPFDEETTRAVPRPQGPAVVQISGVLSSLGFRVGPFVPGATIQPQFCPSRSSSNHLQRSPSRLPCRMLQRIWRIRPGLSEKVWRGPECLSAAYILILIQATNNSDSESSPTHILEPSRRQVFLLETSSSGLCFTQVSQTPSSPHFGQCSENSGSADVSSNPSGFHYPPLICSGTSVIPK